MSENGKLVERITLKIKMFDTGNWEWTVRQRFIKEPRIKLNDMLKILDEVKAEILASEGNCETTDELPKEEMFPTPET